DRGSHAAAGRGVPRSAAGPIRIRRRAGSRASRASHGSRCEAAPALRRAAPPRAGRRPTGRPGRCSAHRGPPLARPGERGLPRAVGGRHRGLVELPPGELPTRLPRRLDAEVYYRQLPLAPLGPEALRKLLEDLLGSDPSTRGLAEAIHARTG